MTDNLNAAMKQFTLPEVDNFFRIKEIMINMI